MRRVWRVEYQIFARGQQARESHGERGAWQRLRNERDEQEGRSLALAERALEGGGDREVRKYVQHARLAVLLQI